MDCASLPTTPLATGQKDKSASGHECCDPRDRVTAALAGVALGLAVALGLLTLQLHEFRVDGAQTPLTGHLPPPPHRVGAPKAKAVFSRSVSHRWMECGTKDLQRLPHGMVGRGLAVYRDSAVSAGNVTRVGRRGYMSS
jgi:hypothetical protein